MVPLKRRVWLCLVGCPLLWLTGCSPLRPPAPRPPVQLAAEQAALADALRALGPSVDRREAARVARVLVETVEAARLASRLEGGAIRRNLAINLGVHDWGLCWHWAELLGRTLQNEGVSTLELHWACAHAGSVLREHNAVVLTAVGQGFDQGLVVDPWRNGGRLTWVRVADDRYQWSPEPESKIRWAHKKSS